MRVGRPLFDSFLGHAFVPPLLWQRSAWLGSVWEGGVVDQRILTKLLGKGVVVVPLLGGLADSAAAFVTVATTRHLLALDLLVQEPPGIGASIAEPQPAHRLLDPAQGDPDDGLRRRFGASKGNRGGTRICESLGTTREGLFPAATGFGVRCLVAWRVGHTRYRIDAVGEPRTAEASTGRTAFPIREARTTLYCIVVYVYRCG